MTSIFVAKLDFGVTEDELKELFKQFGAVSKAHIAKDKETGKPRGFAFVEMPDSTEAKAAIEKLNGATVNGRTIAVSEAEQRGQGNKPQNNAPRHGGNPNPRNTDNSNNSYNQNNSFRKENTPPVRTANETEVGTFDADALKSTANRKVEKKVTKTADKADDGGKKKKPKMEAYKKSGKSRKFFFDDEEEDEQW